MVKVDIYIPQHDNDWNYFPGETLHEKKRLLTQRFGGCTCHGEVRGDYKMDDGTVAHDALWHLSVAIPAIDIEVIQGMVANWGHELDQETVYMEVTYSDVLFVPSAKPETTDNAVGDLAYRPELEQHEPEIAEEYPEPDAPTESELFDICSRFTKKTGVPVTIGEAVQQEDRQLHGDNSRFAVIRDVIERLSSGADYVEVGTIDRLQVGILKKMGYSVLDYHHKGTNTYVIRSVLNYHHKGEGISSYAIR